MKRLLFVIVWIACLLCAGVRNSYAQGGVSLGADLANLGSMNLGAGLGGGGESIPGSILVKINGEIQCVQCTLEAMGLDAAPGDLYQFSRDNTHMVIKITQAGPSTAWELVEGHKFFLVPGEFPEKLDQFMSASTAGKTVQLIGGVTPNGGYFVPISVKVK